ncbi:hypothetical protein PVAND_016189 [Polypedilum vanderplanki]|uniref:Uncharacterized protein n=1 Tax=Polypedilum vanderplanki TaxID=319348 RepID=A0A9J6BEV2_POLVA|nr:hypothetical protein PVAND_016189 [Polypedilum vanderplanki]QLB38528.1 transmembrane protein LIL3 [Polypedilum vanderplanki]
MAFANYIRVDTFLCCFRLESGGLFIGALGLFCAVLQFITQIVLIISLIIVEDFCPDENLIDNYGRVVSQAPNTLKGLENLTNNEIKCAQVSKVPLAVVFFVVICFNFISMIAHYKLIKGLEELNFEKFLLPIGYYIFCIVMKFLFFATMVILTITVSFKMIFPAVILLILTLIDVYLFIVIDTIRYKIENSIPPNVTNTPMTTIHTKLVDANNKDIEIPAEITIPKVYV